MDKTIKILVSYHKPAILLKSDVYVPIHLGRALATQAHKDGVMSEADFEWMCENMIGDDTGENISHLNRYLNELTGIYWAYKNYDKLGNPDYIGHIHYRRHFIFDENINLNDFRQGMGYYCNYEKYDEFYKQLIDIHKFDFSLYDIIAPELFDVRKVPNTNFETALDFLLSFCPDTKGFNFLADLLQNDSSFNQKYNYIGRNLNSEHAYYPCNIFIMKKEVFFEYCEFMFDMIFKIYEAVKKELQERESAWVSEYITSAFIQRQKEEAKKRIKSLNLIQLSQSTSPKVQYDLDILALKDKIRHAQVISFDIFDTLLVRPYAHPKDLFLHLEQIYNAKDFAELRSVAEKKAMKQLKKQQVSFDEIYQFMPAQFLSLKDKEKQMEYELIYAHKAMQEIYNYALSLNKKIFLLSDMYHDEEFIISLLDKCHFKGYDKIFISSKCNFTKHSGSLYYHAFQALKVSRKDILHIGDNAFADIEQAKNFGIETFYMQSPVMRFLTFYPRLKSFYQENKNLTSSIMIGLWVKHWLENGEFKDYWQYLGYFVGGPLVYGLSEFVFEETQRANIEELFFVARDGFSIKKVFELIGRQRDQRQVKTHYVYANRSLNLLMNYNFEELLKHPWQNKIEALFYLIQEYDENFKKTYNMSLTKEQKYEILVANKTLLDQISHSIKKAYKEYIQGFEVQGSKIAVFDGNAQTFSSLRLLQSFFKPKLLGLYWRADRKGMIENIHFKDYEHDCQDVKALSYGFMEFLMSAPELSVIFIDRWGHFVSKNNSLELNYKDTYASIYPYEIDFSKDLLGTFKNFKVSFKCRDLIAYVNFVLKNLDPVDKYYLKNLYIGTDAAHSLHKKLLQDFFKNKALKPALYPKTGACNRIKNQLSYKLGLILVDSKGFLSVLKCPFLILKTIYQFKKNKSPKSQFSLQDYDDYEEALKLKEHLCYKLGNALIKNPLTFLFKAKTIYKEWKNAKNSHFDGSQSKL